MTTRTTRRRAPALGARILVAAGATAATIALTGWMGKAAMAGSGAGSADPAAEVIHRIVVVSTQPAPEPYISLQAAPAGQTMTVVTQPAQVNHPVAAPAAPAAPVAAPVTTSSGS